VVHNHLAQKMFYISGRLVWFAVNKAGSTDVKMPLDVLFMFSYNQITR